MMKSLARISFILIMPVLVSAQNEAGRVDDLVRRPFYIDYAAFYDSLSDNLNVEVYFKVYSSALTYEKRGDRFIASYEVDLIINKKGKQLTGASNEGDLIADDYEMTQSTEDFVTNKIVFILPPDNYELLGRLTDTFSGDERRLKMDMKLKRFKRELPDLSSLEFVQMAEHTEVKSHFYKDGMKLIPSVSRVYGYDVPDMMIYYQIYNEPDFGGDYLVIYEFLKGGKMFRSDTSLFTSGGGVTGQLEHFDVESFMPGKYEILMHIKSPGNRLDLEATAEFIIEWSVLSIVKNDFKTAVEQLRYIASNEEMKALKKVPEDERLTTWKDFWNARDPSPGTPRNELKNEYYKRLRYADLNFGHFGRDGWKSDMGMVYVTYGPADEIERHPFDLDTKPYEIWYYYEQKRRFVFVDRNGYGEYELQYPYDGDLRRFR